MSHSHLAVRHLIRQLDLQGRPRSMHTPPAWLVDFLHATAELFDPCNGDARAGFECRRSNSGWEAAVFLGAQEVVGAREDGRVRPVNFHFDVKALTTRFETIDSINWSAFPWNDAPSAADHSFLTLTGLVAGESLRLQICACPPETCGPAMKVYSDGRSELC